MTESISHEALDALFLKARSHNGWLEKPVDQAVLHQIYQAAVMGPTSMNSLPLRIVFMTSPEAKAKLVPIMAEGNRAKTAAAPVNVLFAYDKKFYEKLAFTAPHMKDAGKRFEGHDESNAKFATLNAALQAGYFILAARAFGLDCGPMGGFNAQAMNDTFFPEGDWVSLFICSLGYGDETKLRPRSPRLDFDTACRII